MKPRTGHEGGEMKIRHLLAILAMAALILSGSFVFAQGHGTGSFGGNLVAMMGNGGMMHGSGGMHDGYRDMPGNYDRSRKQPPAYSGRDRSSDPEIESQKREVQGKRKDLARLYHSGSPDKDLVDRMINELSDLEQALDGRLSGSR
jgi:hypothetical protein